MSDSNDSEEISAYEEVRRLEGHLEHVNEVIANLGIEEDDTVDDLAEKGLDATEIRAAKRYTELMHSIANEVIEARDSDDDDNDDDGSSFMVDKTLR
jgi:hypothetical protein